MTTVSERFWDKVEKSDDDSCWLWTGALDGFGYGLFRVDKKPAAPKRAHRVSYWLTYGDWPGVTRHVCDTPRCVNPNHLISGSQAENNKDIWERDHGHGKFNNEQILAMRLTPDSPSLIKDLAEKYDITNSEVRDILSGKRYMHAPGPLRQVERNRKSGLNDKVIREIMADLENPYWGIGNELARKYGVHPTVISAIKRGIYGPSKNLLK